MIDIHFLYALDILLVSIFIYFLLIFIKQTRSYFIVYGFAILFLIDFIARYLNLGLTRRVLDRLISFFVIICAVIFQREIRRFFRWLVLSRGRLRKPSVAMDREIVDELTKAVWHMAENRVGALIVFSGEFPLDDIVEGGFMLQGMISSPLLLSIFDDATPGHDGAMLIENREIKKFGVHLPLAEDFREFSMMGTRHRAAIGITERTDALALVVSEERGDISLAEGGVLRTLPDKKSLEDAISQFIRTTEEKKMVFKTFVSSNTFLKVVSVAAASLLWFIFVFQSNVVTKDYPASFEFEHIIPGLQVSSIKPDNLDLKLNGDNQDIAALKDGDVSATIDLRDKVAGQYKVLISKDDIVLPTYLNLVGYIPQEVTVTLVPTPISSTQ